MTVGCKEIRGKAVERSVAGRSVLRLSLGRLLGVAVMLALAAGGAGASAQAPTCSPSTTPCQVCPPPPCASGGPSCTPGGVSNVTAQATLSCTGPTPQTTVFVQTIVGPANVCFGEQRSQPCTLAGGHEVVLTEVDTITAAAVLVPTLSLSGLAALAALVGAL